MPTTTLCFPQRPFRLVDAINRMSLATGSTRTAVQAAGADYNGHRVEVSYSFYRNAWSASYTWAGTCWLARMTTFDQALDAAFREHDRGALGSEIRVDSVPVLTECDKPVSTADVEAVAQALHAYAHALTPTKRRELAAAAKRPESD